MKSSINISKTLWTLAFSKRIPGIRLALKGSFLASLVREKSVTILIILLGGFFQLEGIVLPAQETHCFEVIIVDGDLLRTDSGDPDEYITAIRVYESPGQTNMVYYEIGCFESDCTSDLSHLSNGRYYVVATTESGSFSETIQLD